MDDHISFNKPKFLNEIEANAKRIGFTMASDSYLGSLLKTLVASKAKSRMLELGTGIGYSLSWMIDGMDRESSLISIDHDSGLTEMARVYFGEDPRVEIICMDGARWIDSYKGAGFDLVFADAWPGKFSHLGKVLELINVGGFYIIDDLTILPNWPKGHEENVRRLIDYLEKREDFNLTKLDWSSGIIVMSKKA